MMRVLRKAWWWVRDYVYAGLWQVRAFFDRRDPAELRVGDGTTVLLIPGVYETWQFLRPLAEKISARGHPVHVVDRLRRNRGTVVDAASGVEEYLREHDLDDVVIVAHSKGGLIGKQVMVGPLQGRIRGMVAVATPFGGSSYARLMLVPTLRAFSPRDATIVSLGGLLEANSRIVSVYGTFDPHIPQRSELLGARNILLDTGGHFRILTHPRVLEEVVRIAE